LGAKALEKSALERDLDDITSLRAKIGKGVGGINHYAGEDTLDLSHVDVLELNLLVDEVSSPEADAVVVDGDQLAVRVVEELDLVGGVGSNWVSTESLAGGDLYLNCQMIRINLHPR
jgi:hypothetical protein